MLPAGAIQADPTLNVLGRADLAKLAEDRIALSVGTVDADRPRRNMLSSQPLCFNLFGPLCTADRGLVGDALQMALHMDMTMISPPIIEWTLTPAENYLNDRTAFDAYVEYNGNDHKRGFVAVETKYTDSFSADNDIIGSEAKREKYRQAAIALTEYDNDRIDELFHPKVSQLFRNALLTSLWRRHGGFDFGVCLVAALADDDDAVEAVDRLAAVLLNPSYVVRHRTHEDSVDALGTVPELGSWATDFRTRYLDTARRSTDTPCRRQRRCLLRLVARTDRITLTVSPS